MDNVYDPKKVEKDVAEYWKKHNIPDKVRELSAKQKKPFFFMDGPPYATGHIHLGTALNKSLKDIIIRVKRMQGYHVFDKPGYDGHGVPIEYKIEQEIGTKNKKDIEKFGVENFVNRCRKFASEHIETMNNEFLNIGVWMDWKNPYITFSNDYIEGIWFSFKKADEKGLLYKGLYSVHVCTRCETAVAFNEIEHKDVSDPAIYVKFKVSRWAKEKADNLNLLVWTTTPWTIPANTGVMVHPDLDYIIADTGKEKLIVAKPLADAIFKKAGLNHKIIRTVKGKELIGLEYEHPLKNIVEPIKNLKNGHRVVPSARYVEATEGTGLVHTAPGHGREDYIVGKEQNLPFVSFVKLDGTYSEETGRWLAGKFVKKADTEIIEKLSELGALFYRESVTHSYPHCWRCKTPLLQIAVPQWFFKVSDIQKKLIKANEEVKWVPDWGKTRFKDWLENLSDWPVSRARYWGTPLPIWECEKCDNKIVVGSVAELKKLVNVPENLDLHRPWIDKIKIPCRNRPKQANGTISTKECGCKMNRVPEVLDVWFDSGVCSWASLNYPKEQAFFKKFWPPDINIEGKDQIRGWWNSEIITSFICFGKKPFKSIVMHGMILDLEKRKMSKSLGNVVQPSEVIEKFGRDHMRYYLCRESKGEDFTFDWNALKDVHNSFNILWNVAQFVKTYAPEEPKNAEKNLLMAEDKWLLSKVNSFCGANGNKLTEDYKVHEYIRDITDFILNDFSRWYVKIIRDRVSPFYDGSDKSGAQYTLRSVLEKCLSLMAPVTPYLAEAIYTDLYKGRESVHLAAWPEKDGKKVDNDLERGMELVKEIVEAVNSLRQEAKIKARWPLYNIILQAKNQEDKNLLKPLLGVIENMANCEEVEFSDKLKNAKEFQFGFLGLGQVDEDEALLRELSRKVQALRKEGGLHVADSISLELETDKKTHETLKKLEKELLKSVGGKTVAFTQPKEVKGDIEFEGIKINIGFRKAN